MEQSQRFYSKTKQTRMAYPHKVKVRLDSHANTKGGCTEYHNLNFHLENTANQIRTKRSLVWLCDAYTSVWIRISLGYGTPSSSEICPKSSSEFLSTRRLDLRGGSRWRGRDEGEDEGLPLSPTVGMAWYAAARSCSTTYSIFCAVLTGLGEIEAYWS